MGIYGALSTAVTGLRAQSFALENISGNIANSQTTGFKRIDTDFIDLIPDQPRKLQTSGSVLAQARATNTSQGDVKSVANPTYMAVNGAGFFVVEPSIGTSDGNALFAGTSYYTRRGDFDIDKSGYLVNGSGYYLKGLPVDPSTGNLSSSLPEVIRLSNNFLPASATTRINYQLNLPLMPQTNAFKEAGTPGSELLDKSDFIPADTPAVKSGTGMSFTGAETLASLGFVNGDTITMTVGATVVTHTVAAGDDVADLITTLDGAANSGVALSSGNIVATATGTTNSVVFSNTGTGTLASLGLDTTAAPPTVSAGARVNTITAAQASDFQDQSISGGTVTVYTETGAPANVQLRWAKIDSEASGGADTWNLYYQNNSQATGSATEWTRVPVDYTFVNGAINPPITDTDLTGVTIDGVNIGAVRLDFGAGGITQFNDPNGVAGVTALSQNGYAAGQYVSVAIDDNGRVVVSYSNNQQVEVAQVVTATFNAANQLKRLDGGIFQETADSGTAILDTSGGIVGSSLESSNTDISEEFTKLIVTQQAYAAGTRIVSTADQMIQEALNMVR
jgi:flagellar hook protein FlgE